jgi:hypothetical protein
MCLGLWSECENVSDHVTAYDGPGLPITAPPSPVHGKLFRQLFYFFNFVEMSLIGFKSFELNLYDTGMSKRLLQKEILWMCTRPMVFQTKFNLKIKPYVVRNRWTQVNQEDQEAFVKIYRQAMPSTVC